MTAPEIIRELVERFSLNIDEYKSSGYNETQLRREFLDPFFEALEWDVNNKLGYALAYREVIHEDAIKVGGFTKAPDYSFRVGGTRKFFVEAKRPFVSIKEDINPAFQLRRYAWSAKLPLSILTDFEEFAVYDTRVKPVKTDKASTARVLFAKYTEYEERWDEIAGVFSRDAVLKGSFDKYAESTKVKRGTAEVDDVFLKEIESWRDALARNIALRNPGLTQRELNFAVQVTIDRIIFLRICEDRGIETYGQLMALQNGANVYGRLRQLYRHADERYNSGLFHFQSEKGRPEAPDSLTPQLSIDDKVLKEIFKKLYYPDSPYEFSVLSADILGQVYEQFLGKVIVLTPGHKARVEDKPEVKKAGGVYYTPTYIVDYIVKQTVGKLLEGKTPRQVSKLKILDPACGSGSFLIGAYQHLLEWHLQEYSKDPAKYKKMLYAGPGGEWRLTTAERKRILLNNIYGVDIDTQAVEVTKLSLLLKVLEGENEETLNAQLRLFHERALPDLANNIKCGNSLIGPDLFEQQMSLLDPDEVYRINAFDWNKEFAEIMEAGGFDAVIGNPPYVRQEALGLRFKNYAKGRFEAYAGTADLYVYFIEQSHRLLRQGGLFGMITSNKFMRANYGKALRDFMVSKTTLRQIVDFGELPVFQKAATFPAIILTKNKQVRDQRFVYAPIKRLTFQSLENEVELVGSELDSRSLAGDNWTLARSEEISIIEKMKKAGEPLGEYVCGEIYWGIKTGLNEAFVIDKETRDRLVSKDPKSASIIKPFVVGDDVRKFYIHFRERYLVFTRRGININDYPAIERYLSDFKKRLLPRPKTWSGATWQGRKPGAYKWYEIQDTVDYYEAFYQPKLVYPEFAKEPRFAFDENCYFTNNKTFIIPRADKYLLGLLNSKLCWLFLKRSCSALGDPDRGGRLELRDIYLEKVPIRRIDFSNSEDKALHDQMVALVERMLDLHKQLAAATLSHDKKVIQTQIDATDRQIDKLVYDLYGLTEEEIEIVEDATR